MKEWNQKINQLGLNGTGTISLHHFHPVEKDQTLSLTYRVSRDKPEDTQDYISNLTNQIAVGLGIPRVYLGDFHHGTR